jgi:hypothetical protein
LAVGSKVSWCRKAMKKPGGSLACNKRPVPLLVNKKYMTQC